MVLVEHVEVTPDAYRVTLRLEAASDTVPGHIAAVISAGSGNPSDGVESILRRLSPRADEDFPPTGRSLKAIAGEAKTSPVTIEKIEYASAGTVLVTLALSLRAIKEVAGYDIHGLLGEAPSPSIIEKTLDELARELGYTRMRVGRHH